MGVPQAPHPDASARKDSHGTASLDYAVILVVSGIVALVRTQVLYGVVLIVVGLLVGPGGVSIFT